MSFLKIWRYKVPGAGGRPRTRQTSAFDVVYGCGIYITRGQQEDAQKAAFENAFLNADFAPDAIRAGEYLTGEHDRDDFRGSVGHNLRTHDVSAQVKKLATLAAKVGLDHFYHYTWSPQPGVDFTAEQLRRQNRTIMRVLEIERCPSIEAHHGHAADGDMPLRTHGHGILLSVDEQGVGKPLADGWYKEASQIAIAVIERDDDLRPEPNRRYIATDRGVEHFLTGELVADASGRIFRSKDPERLDRNGKLRPDGGLLKRLREAHDAIIAADIAQTGFRPGEEWPFSKYVETVVAPRLKKANSWSELHRLTAPLGVIYNIVGSTGRLERIGPDGRPTGEWVGAGVSYANAALGKLSHRLKSTYQAPPADLKFRPLTMPVYTNRPFEDEEQAERKTAAKDAKDKLRAELAAARECIAQASREEQQALVQARLGSGYNAAAAAIAAKRKVEERVLHDFAISKGAKRKPRGKAMARGERGSASPWERLRLLIWGKRKRRGNQMRSPFVGEYEVRHEGDTRQFWGKRSDGSEFLAFSETDNLVIINDWSRRSNIDALQLADRKFVGVRVIGHHDAAKDTVKIAAELGLVLADDQATAGAAHIDKIASRQTSDLLGTSSRYHRDLDKRQRLRARVQYDRHSGNRPAPNAHSIPSGEPDQIAPIGTQATALAKRIREACRELVEKVDHDTFLLVRSRYSTTGSVRSMRFLDDPKLVDAFITSPNLLATKEMQGYLHAIEETQLAKRRWIASAIAAGIVSIDQGQLSVSGQPGHWAEQFWSAQRTDPTFLRLIYVARARPERFAIDLATDPAVAAQNAARASGDLGLAEAILQVAQGRFLAEKRYRDGYTHPASRARNSTGEDTSSRSGEIHQQAARGRSRDFSLGPEVEGPQF